MPADIERILTDESNREPAHIISGILYQGQTLAISGMAGVGKSFLAYNMAMCISSGLPFLDHSTTMGRVLYFDEENSTPDFEGYLKQIWRGLSRPDIAPIKENLIIEHLAIPDYKQDLRFAWIRARAENIKPILIIIDTATPVCAIDNENDNAEATHVIKELRLARDTAGPQTAMLILKHAKIDHQDNDRITMRGAKAWDGALDGTLYHTNRGGKPPKDGPKAGLRATILKPGKTRAYGLKTEIIIDAIWTEDRGIKLEKRETNV